jgi:hypothetical protein
LGHPDEINAKEISLGRQMNTDEHGLKRKFVSPSARKDTKHGYHLRYIMTFLRRRRFIDSV